MPQLKLLPGAISAMLADLAETQTLTESDRYGLMAAIMDESLGAEERQAIDRILRSVVRGRLTVL